MKTRLWLGATALAALAGCPAGNGGDGGGTDDMSMSGGDVDMTVPEIVPDFAGAPPGSDLTFTSYRMDVVVNLVDDPDFPHATACDDPRANLTAIRITATATGDASPGAMATTTVDCPAGRTGINAVIELPVGEGTFDLTATTIGGVTATGSITGVEFGQTPGITVVLFPPDMAM